jgi:hypothetical protein
MGLFGKLFGNKAQEESKKIDLGDGILANEKGEVYGEFQLKTSFNGQEFIHKIPINTNFEKLEHNFKQNEANKANPNSCEREPNENEIKISCNEYDKYLPILSEFEEIREKYYSTMFNGYNNIVISQNLYNELESKLKQHNDFNILLNKTSELNNKGIQFEKDGNIQDAIQVYEENIKLGYPATHSYERLMVLYDKQKDSENEKRVVKAAINVFFKANQERAEQAILENPKLKEKIIDGLNESKRVLNEDGLICFNPYNVYSYQKRLEKLENNLPENQISLPENSTQYTVKGTPLGIQYEQIIKSLPEFDFYNGNTHLLPNRHQEFVTNPKQGQAIWKIQNLFNSLLVDAQRKEDDGYLDEATIIYEQIVSERYYLSAPYDRLIKIYSKSKLTHEEKRVLELAINHFTKLRDRQKEYVLYLAEKYGKLDFAKDYIDNGKKITYYGGAFELYNPYPIIETWKKRLLKLTK